MSRGGHQTGRWYKRSARHKRQNPTCLCCSAIRVTRPAEIADHVVPVTAQDGDLLKGEIQSCCRRCHDTVKRALEALFQQGKCRVEDLKLDSKMAQRLRRRQPSTMRYGIDGRILDPDDPSNQKRPYSDGPSEALAWVRIDGKEEPATPEPTRTLPKHLAAALARQKAWKPT
jgi:hypothetical protein